jgi:cytochrome oxidase assembly protein ShyY1
MLLVATICVLAGTWQIARLAGKVQANDKLRGNAHAAAVPVEQVLPVIGRGSRPSDNKVQFRKVTASGVFDAAHTSLVRQRTVNDNSGFLVLTPLRSGGGTLLVVRGFIATTSTDPAALQVPAPPSGTVTVSARVEPGETRNDAAARLAGGQVESINPVEQAGRLGTATYNGYGELLSGQPGVGTLIAIPNPDLSNPAGGAIEPQHIAYIIQWYLFALLALAAPFAMVRAETRHQPAGEFDAAAPETVPGAERTPEQLRAAKLADRYGRAVR